MFSSPGPTSHFLSDFAMLIRADVLWVELILCNSWQAWPGWWIRKMGYIEITMKIMMSDSHNLSGDVLTRQHGVNVTNINIFDQQI